jgi:hypothetical protein
MTRLPRWGAHGVSRWSLGMDDNEAVRLAHDSDDWALACVDERLVVDAKRVPWVSGRPELLARTVRTYGYGLLAFTRWLRTSWLTRRWSAPTRCSRS